MAQINPYTELGRIHNDVLDYCIAHNADPTEDEFQQMIADYMSDYFVNTIPAFNSNCKMLAGLAMNTSYVDKNIVKTNIRWNGQQLIFLEQLLTEPSYPPEPYYSSIQDDIFSSSLTPRESRILLGAVAIGMNSGLYWEGAYSNALDPWHSFMISTNKVKKVTFEDVLAYLEAWADAIGEDGNFSNDDADKALFHSAASSAWEAYTGI